MALRRIGAMLFLEPMLIYHRLEHNEQLSVKYFAGFRHFPCHKNATLFNIFWGITKYCRCLRVNLRHNFSKLFLASPFYNRQRKKYIFGFRTAFDVLGHL